MVYPLLAAAALAIPGCGDGASDFDRTKSGAPLKMPSEIKREADAEAKSRAAKAEGSAPADAAKAAPK